MALQGQCLCSTVAYEITQLDSAIGHCHCRTCRKAQGAAFASTARVLRSQFRWLRGADRLTGYQSSPGKTRWFCSRCGSHLAAERTEQPHVILRVATRDDDPGKRPVMHIRTSHDLPWLDTSDGVPRHETVP